MLQRPFKSFVVDGDDCLPRLVLHVHRNPWRPLSYSAHRKATRGELATYKMQDARCDPCRGDPCRGEVSHLAKAKARVLRAMMQTYGVAEESVCCRDRKRNEPRDVAIYLSRLHTGCLLREIGDYFGGIRPAAVSSAGKRIAPRMQMRRQFRETIAQLAARLEEDWTSKRRPDLRLAARGGRAWANGAARLGSPSRRMRNPGGAWRPKPGRLRQLDCDVLVVFPVMQVPVAVLGTRARAQTELIRARPWP